MKYRYQNHSKIVPKAIEKQLYNGIIRNRIANLSPETGILKTKIIN